ncbi:hypothetical protein A3715_03700 [Oleiphilus sp. HI0009]|nr:hypothetical protein A3715_22355 [Oleiphilus sp. HI0009]KZX85438.1 hypothetical protein A3715_03700 [Oleiphilus sp. HI0009]
MNKLRVVLGVVLLCFIGSVRADEPSLCAVVKIEIAQELTLERQAFEATMRITNSLDTFRLEQTTIDLLFEDADGNPVVVSSDPNSESASFFVNLDDSRNIVSLQEGTQGRINDGVIEPQETAELRWLIIPTAGAGGDSAQGKLYYVGATLNFTYGSETQTITVAPDSIVVKPQPLLVLDYFLTEEINGDNPFTQEIEPIEPYTLGVRIGNTGSGPANSVKLESAQPEIVENEHNLAIGFDIVGSYVEDLAAAKSLLLFLASLCWRLELDPILSGW